MAGSDADAVTILGPAARRIPARTVVWAAGVRASGLARALGEATGAGGDSAGRVAVGPGLTLPGHPEVLAVGDLAQVHDHQGHVLDLPGVAPAAMQEGRHAARVIKARLAGAVPPPFRYFDKGSVAAIGTLKAVADIRGLRLTGTLAWLAWLFIHLLYLVGLENRVLVFIRWTVSLVTRGRGARLITGRHLALADRRGRSPGPPAPRLVRPSRSLRTAQRDGPPGQRMSARPGEPACLR